MKQLDDNVGYVIAKEARGPGRARQHDRRVHHRQRRGGAISFPDGGVTPLQGPEDGEAWEGGYRAPRRWSAPGRVHIKPGTVKNQLFAALDWLPTLVDIAGRPTGDGLVKAADRGGRYPGITKTTLDGFDQRAYLEGTSGEVRARLLLLLLGRDAIGDSLQELEDVLQHVPGRGGRLAPAARSLSLHARPEHQARPVRAGGRPRSEDRAERRRRPRQPVHEPICTTGTCSRSASSSGRST